MANFNIKIETDYNVNSSFGSNGNATVELTFDPDSREAFFTWLAGGCTTDLVLNDRGCRAAVPNVLIAKCEAMEKRIEELQAKCRLGPDHRIHYPNGESEPWPIEGDAGASK